MQSSYSFWGRGGVSVGAKKKSNEKILYLVVTRLHICTNVLSFFAYERYKFLKIF